MVDQTLDLPRFQVGRNPQHLLVTLLGDFWANGGEPLPSRGLVSLLEEFNITAASARAALVRLASRGVLVGTRIGRQTYYCLASHVVEAGIARRDALIRFGAGAGIRPPWDGEWLLLSYTVPGAQSATRMAFRSALQHLGLAQFQDTIWIGPSTKAVRLSELVANNPAVTTVVLRGHEAYPLGVDISLLWDTENLVAEYHDFIKQYAPVCQRMDQGQISPREALVIRTEVMTKWRTFLVIDPDLPDEVFAESAARQEARRILVAIYDGLGPLAESRCQGLMSPASPNSVAAARHYTIEGYLAAHLHNG